MSVERSVTFTGVETVTLPAGGGKRLRLGLQSQAVAVKTSSTKKTLHERLDLSANAHVFPSLSDFANSCYTGLAIVSGIVEAIMFNGVDVYITAKDFETSMERLWDTIFAIPAVFCSRCNKRGAADKNGRKFCKGGCGAGVQSPEWTFVTSSVVVADVPSTSSFGQVSSAVAASMHRTSGGMDWTQNPNNSLMADLYGLGSIPQTNGLPGSATVRQTVGITVPIGTAALSLFDGADPGALFEGGEKCEAAFKGLRGRLADLLGVAGPRVYEFQIFAKVDRDDAGFISEKKTTLQYLKP
jgi:hypothetical protein